MNAHYKGVVSKLDLGGMEAREQRREQIKKEEAQQQVAFDSAAAVRRGFQSFLDEAHREINVKRMLNDPVELYFRLANSKPHLT